MFADCNSQNDFVFRFVKADLIKLAGILGIMH